MQSENCEKCEVNYMVIIYLLIGIAVGGSLGYLIFNYIMNIKVKKGYKEANKILEEAKEETNRIRKEKLLDAKERIQKMRDELEIEMKKRRGEIQTLESRLIRRQDNLENKEAKLERRMKQLEDKERDYQKRSAKLSEMIKTELKELENIASLSVKDARELVLKRVRQESEYEIAKIVKNVKDEMMNKAEKEAKWILATAIQRYAPDYVGEITVSTVSIPSDDMKGRIIGREGRNIRTFESLTGVDLIVDDTPEVVVLSCFNPLRREVARIALEKLITDGRIHPARIEDMYEKAKEEVAKSIQDAGEEAMFKVGITSLHPELIKLIGKLRYRSSFGQNVLQHSIEVAQLAAMMAEELDLNADKVKRAGLLHDIGKAVDHEVEGSHAIIGAEITKRYREKPDVINMIAAHHGEVDPLTPEAVIIQAADALSAARPGVRRETVDTYIERLEKLEQIATSFDHVEKAYAMQAGRELRIIVEANEIDDVMCEKLSYDVAHTIEESLDYPGQLKVTVIREKRFVQYAK